MIVIPDSIEPLTGYKWLQLHDGELTSNYDRARWPVRQPMEATCIRDWGHEWQPLPWYQQRKLIKLPNEITYHGGHPLGSNTNFPSTSHPRYGIGEDVFYGTAPKKPKIKLPPSLKWSLEVKPPPHASPGKDCTCGVYSMASRGKELDRYRASHRAVLVKLAAWGKVIPADSGNRAEFAYPTKILDFTAPLTLADIETVANLYGIELTYWKKTETPKQLASKANEMGTPAQIYGPAPWQRKTKKKRSLW